MKRFRNRLFYQIMNAIIICSIFITMIVSIIVLNNFKYELTVEADEKYATLVKSFAQEIEASLNSVEDITRDIATTVAVFSDFEQYNSDPLYRQKLDEKISALMATSARSSDLSDAYFFVFIDGNERHLVGDPLDGDENSRLNILRQIEAPENVFVECENWLVQNGDFYYHQPVYEGRILVGHICGAYSMDTLNQKISAFKEAHTIEIRLFDGQMNSLLLDANVENEFSFEVARVKTLVSGTDSGTFESEDNHGDDQVNTFHRLNNGWVIFASTSRELIDERMDELVYILAKLIIISSIFVIFIASSVSERIVNPLDQIVNIVIQIGKGELHTEIPKDFLQYRNEIGLLAGAVESMRVSIRAYINQIKDHSSHLASEVSLRTRELQETNQQLHETIEEMEIKDRKLEESNGCLESTIAELKNTQDELLKSQKLAAINSMVRGVSHKLNTPVGTMITALSYQSMEIRSFFKQLDKECPNAHKYSEEMAEILESTNLTMQSLLKTRGILDTLRSITSDFNDEIRQTCNVTKIIHDVVESFENERNTKAYAFKLIMADEIWINTYPDVLTQILTQLIMNSVTHGFKNHEDGLITIDVWQEASQLHLIYEDNGSGIKDADRVFDPFYTSDLASEKSGLGLSIIHNQVTITLGGEIECDKTCLVGTRFIIKLPTN